MGARAGPSPPEHERRTNARSKWSSEASKRLGHAFKVFVWFPLTLEPAEGMTPKQNDPQQQFRETTVGHGRQWETTGGNGVPRETMGGHGRQRGATGGRGRQREATGAHELWPTDAGAVRPFTGLENFSGPPIAFAVGGISACESTKGVRRALAPWSPREVDGGGDDLIVSRLGPDPPRPPP